VMGDVAEAAYRRKGCHCLVRARGKEDDPVAEDDSNRLV